MHVPEKWQMNGTDEIHDFIRTHGFGALISPDFEASHLPLLLRADEGEQGVLYGHFARANRHWKTAVGRVLVIFSGPHSYISPTWYKSSPAVPTWNYAAVHAVGVLELTDDATTMQMLDKTVSKYEPELEIPAEYKDKLSKGIVGFKITIETLQGNEKLGQHRSAADQAGVAQALCLSDSLESQQLCQYMRRREIGLGS
ncbi:FMN-binding negative transcriptional regulator [Shewanella corallii]|uniref:FMN-binding negative transcriptional regulator n=1 Tax=Shewanella corallii TaxID=560080 RepID=A0ABT0N3Q9_9GAMM|nr:FMN-binding negative transcriptional regulator [Shewanella corallii]MCL2912815.1 FMN-binding negative transcriptional regulator [Shewanella corallii]